jgi:hypothetical protein
MSESSLGFIEALSKIEDKSHILAWKSLTLIDSAGVEVEADFIDLPRLNISFKCRVIDGQTHYFFRDHKDDLRFYSHADTADIDTSAGNIKTYTG